LQEKGIEAKGEIMFGLSPQIVAVFIPILAVIGTFAMIITVVIMGSRQKELEHRERIIAMEKGMEIPKEPDKVRRPPHLTMRAWGLVLSAVGIIVFLGIWVEEGFRYSLWGLLPAAVGVALLISARLEKKEKSDL
jgi:protein-S-isoprenylcysteine O-methyltransferase Ste14